MALKKRLLYVVGIILGIITLRRFRKRRAKADEPEPVEDEPEEPEEPETASDHAQIAAEHAQTAAEHGRLAAQKAVKKKEQN